MASFFIIAHESPQQLPQHDALLSLLAWFAVCATAAPANASVSPSTNAGTDRRKQFISISPVRKIIAGTSEHADASSAHTSARDSDLQAEF